MEELVFMEVKQMIQLGSRVRDIHTGFTGIAVARTEYLHSSAKILVESKRW